MNLSYYFQDFIESGGAALWGLVLVVGVVSILIGDVHARRRRADKEVKQFVASGYREANPWAMNLICFVTLFLFDWLYAIVFKWFGKKRFVYPTLLTIIGTLIGGLSRGDMSGDLGEFVYFGLVPGYVTIHCLGWLHVNIVYFRIRKYLHVSRSS